VSFFSLMILMWGWIVIFCIFSPIIYPIIEDFKNGKSILSFWKTCLVVQPNGIVIKIIINAIRVLCLSCVVYIIVYAFSIHSKDMGSMFESSNYKSQYYVYAYPGQEVVKSYKLIADISRTDGEYSVDKAYFPNGGYLYFEDGFVYKYKKGSMTDQDGKDWYIELTTEKVGKNAPYETKSNYKDTEN